MNNHLTPALAADYLDWLIKERRAIRRFLTDPVPDDIIQQCLELAVLAPNSCNLQPWEFIVVKSPEMLEKLHSVCLNQRAAKAPLIIVVLAKPGAWKKACPAIIQQWPEPVVPDVIRTFYAHTAPFQYDQGTWGVKGALKRLLTCVVGWRRPAMRSPSSHAEMNVWAVKSCALAAENLMLAFQSRQYGTCPMEGFDERRLRRLLKYDSTDIPIMLLAVGKPGEKAVYGPRFRFDSEECVRWL